MNMKIVYTYSARKDLRDIYEYIAHTLLAPETARSLIEKIMSEIRSLEESPERNMGFVFFLLRTIWFFIQ